MNRKTTITLAIALAVTLAAVPLGTAVATTNEQADETESVAPGEQLSGVVGVQDAEINGELSERTYGIKLANAQTDDERADVVEAQLVDVDDRLEELEHRLETLEDDRDNGEISDGQYRAKVATVAAERATAERITADAQATAGALPETLLNDRGIDVEAIEDLRDRAHELGGQEVAAIAQSIAGDAVGQSPGPDREPGAPIETPGPDRTSDSVDQGDEEADDSPSDAPDEDLDNDGTESSADDEDSVVDSSDDEYDETENRADQ